MPPEATDFRPFHFSTTALPERERLPFWREVFGREYCHIDIEPLSQAPFEAKISLRALPGLRIMSCFCDPSRQERTPELVAKSDDAITLAIRLSGEVVFSQRGREAALGHGEAVLVLHPEPVTIVNSRVKTKGLLVPRAALATLVDGIEELAMRVIPRGNEALRLLTIYLQSLHDDLALATPELQRLVATHVQDLIATAIGTTRDGAAIAQERGVRAARLAAIKSDVIAHLGDGALNVNAVAARHGVTPRSVQLLFEGEGITFSQFVLERRLAAAHRMLSDPRHAGMTVAAIALAAGFGDLSHFNRCFRRRYGAAPSDVRAASHEGGTAR